MSYFVYDNFLEKDKLSKIQNTIMENNSTNLFPWFYFPSVASPDHYDPYDEDHGFSHGLYNCWRPFDTSPYNELFDPLYQKLNPVCLIRSKINLSLKTNTHINQGKHIDIPGSNGLTAVFYLNTNNGKTCLEINNETIEIDSVENRVVIFNSNVQHYGVTQTDEKARYVVNINYYPISY